MKKSLLAVAALGAFASAAQAQSSVTVYGIIDASFSSVSSSTPTTASGNVNKRTTTKFGDSQEQSSRLGFKGQEDLGGGLSAFFTVETGLTNTSSQFSTVNNRQSFVGLGKKGLGNAAIGTQYTQLHNAFAATDPGQNNNTVGNVVRPVSGTDGGQSSASSAYTISTTNTLTAQSDSFAGFKINGALTQNGVDATQRANNTTVVTNGGNTNFTGYSLSANYTWQKLFVTAAYQSFKIEANNTATAVTAATVGSPGTTWSEASLPNTTDTQWYAGGTYDFGILKAYLQYINKKVTAAANTNFYSQRSAQQIGVRSYITPTIEGWANIGNGSHTTFGAGQPKANFVAWQTGLNYYLSKRTNVYGIYGSNQMSSAQPVNPSLSANAFAVGVRHTF
jgi:predicted porin